ncbi:MAG: 3-phosphoshikimate 1-carboxyvinyltransferase [Gammaproteobacteria bacterium]|nr:3-phosphoshikimate 1-carboxyvinyltransferase [Gammaproteobacteria bacterium]
MSHRIDYIIKPGGKLTGRVRVPGDKSISHRSVMLGSLAEGETRVTGLLEGEDVLSTLGAFRAMSVRAEGPDKGRLVIHGAGLHGLKAPRNPLDVGNSGTAMRLMAGILVGQTFDSQLIGDASLNKRPMKRVAEPLSRMGAVIQTAEGGRPPLRIKGGQKLHGIEYQMPVASAQVKSSLLLAGLYAQDKTSIIEPAPARDHTERMLRGFGYKVKTEGARISLRGGSQLKACNIDVPADISSAAFFLVGASIAPGSDLVLEHVGINPTRIGALSILKFMGADLELLNTREVGGEPVADIHVRAAKLHGIRIPEDQVPLAIDEFPALFIAAACAEGETVLTGARELRVKESDRIAVMAQGLKQLGIDARETPDGIIIKGGRLQGGEIDSHGDHRIAMSFAIAGLCASGPVTVRDCKNVDTSFPGFVQLSAKAGLAISVNRES